MGSNSNNSCLKWEDFESNLAAAFYDLRDEADFFDVTLSCGSSGKKNIRAHRVILSACSSFFKTLLKNQAQHQPHPNPYIYLKGVSYNDLSSLIDFMYYGEVSIPQDNINSFMNIAEELKVKGLLNKDVHGHSKTKGSTKEPKKLTFEKKLESPVKKQRPSTRLALADFSHENESFKATDNSTSADVKNEPQVEDTNGGQSLIAGLIADYENGNENGDGDREYDDENNTSSKNIKNTIKYSNEILNIKKDSKPNGVRKMQITYTAEGLKIVPIPADGEEDENSSDLTPSLSPIRELTEKESKASSFSHVSADESLMESEKQSNFDFDDSSIQSNNFQIRDIPSEHNNSESIQSAHNATDEYFGEYGEQLDKILNRVQNDWCCLMCGKKSDRKDNMRRHVENVHLPRVLQCKICSAQVRNHQTFYRHMKVKHGLSKYREVDMYKIEVTNKPGEELVSTKPKETPQSHPPVTTRYVDKRSENYYSNKDHKNVFHGRKMPTLRSAYEDDEDTFC